jgi:hypothetical protein
MQEISLAPDREMMVLICLSTYSDFDRIYVDAYRIGDVSPLYWYWNTPGWLLLSNSKASTEIFRIIRDWNYGTNLACVVVFLTVPTAISVMFPKFF